MNFNVSPRSFAEALEFLQRWQWVAIAVWTWALIWLLEAYPSSLRAYLAVVPKHPVIAGIGSFATVWGFVSFIHDTLRSWRLRDSRKKGRAPEDD
jgi:hypothetical protein